MIGPGRQILADQLRRWCLRILCNLLRLQKPAESAERAEAAETAEAADSAERSDSANSAERAESARSAESASNVRDINTLQVTADFESSTPLQTLVSEQQSAADQVAGRDNDDHTDEKPTYSKPYECLIEPLMLVHLGSETQGLIDEILVDRGEHVKRGQIIARLKSSVETRRVEQAQNRAAMTHETDARTADLKLAELVLERATSLESQQLASSQELDEARALYRVAEAELQQARGTKAQFELDLLLAQALLEQRVVRSPIDGVVIEQNAFAGEVIKDKHIVTVAQLSPLRVEVILPLSEYGKYHLGARAMVTQERGGDVIDGYLQVIDPMIDPGSGTFGIRVHIDNAEGSILAGQTCSVSLETSSEARLTSSFEE